MDSYLIDCTDTPVPLSFSFSPSLFLSVFFSLYSVSLFSLPLSLSPPSVLLDLGEAEGIDQALRSLPLRPCALFTSQGKCHSSDDSHPASGTSITLIRRGGRVWVTLR